MTWGSFCILLKEATPASLPLPSPCNVNPIHPHYLIPWPEPNVPATCQLVQFKVCQGIHMHARFVAHTDTAPKQPALGTWSMIHRPAPAAVVESTLTSLTLVPQLSGLGTHTTPTPVSGNRRPHSRNQLILGSCSVQQLKTTCGQCPDTASDFSRWHPVHSHTQRSHQQLT